MFTSIAVNPENIIRARLKPPVIIKVPVAAELVVGRAERDIFVTSPAPAIPSSRQIIETMVSHDTLARLLSASCHDGVGCRAIVSGTLSVAACFERPDGLVGFTRFGLPFSTSVELPEVECRGIMRAAAEVSIAPAWWDGPLGTTFGCFIGVRVVVTREDIIVIYAVVLPDQSPSAFSLQASLSETVPMRTAPFRGNRRHACAYHHLPSML